MLCNAKFRKRNVGSVTEGGATNSVIGSDADNGCGNERGGKTLGTRLWY